MYQVPWGSCLMKKRRDQKSRDTVPLIEPAVLAVAIPPQKRFRRFGQNNREAACEVKKICNDK
jgi:hypothetical protein